MPFGRKTNCNRCPSDKDTPLKTISSPHDLDPSSERVSDWARFGSLLAALPPRRARFVKEYVIDLNPTRAARDAGYAIGSAHVEGFRLLRAAPVAQAVELALELRNRERRLDKQFVVDKLLEMVDLCSREVPITDRKGNVIGYDIASPPSALKALELLGKTLGIFTDVQEHRGHRGGAIEVIATPMSDDRLMEVARILRDINALPVLEVGADGHVAPKMLDSPPEDEEGPLSEPLEEVEEPAQTWDWDQEDEEQRA